MAALVSKKLRDVEDSQWTLQLGDNSVVVREQVDRVAKVLIVTKDFISSAVSAEPHAALAWAGVCVLLPVSLLSISLLIHYTIIKGAYLLESKMLSPLKIYTRKRWHPVRLCELSVATLALLPPHPRR